jgi:hypothetical protein
MYLYFLGLIFINTSKAIQSFEEEGRKEEAMLSYGNRFRGSIPSKHLYHYKIRVSAFLIDENHVGDRF